jgi:hypothetical protein
VVYRLFLLITIGYKIEGEAVLSLLGGLLSSSDRGPRVGHEPHEELAFTRILLLNITGHSFPMLFEKKSQSITTIFEQFI